ncbi:MAG: hypothetical protein KBA26_09540 [Candidatus Delongbacteria bacterium]|nr:hypothetical protein [Candidatus Delongbacteria bacterium]
MRIPIPRIELVIMITIIIVLLPQPPIINTLNGSAVQENYYGIAPLVTEGIGWQKVMMGRIGFMVLWWLVCWSCSGMVFRALLSYWRSRRSLLPLIRYSLVSTWLWMLRSPPLSFSL